MLNYIQGKSALGKVEHKARVLLNGCILARQDLDCKSVLRSLSAHNYSWNILDMSPTIEHLM